MKALRTAGKYALLILSVTLLVLALEFLSGLMPQERIRANLLASMEQLKSEGLDPGILYQGHPRSKLDNLSENYILTYSYYMDTRTDPGSILTNPGRQIQDPYDELFLQTENLLANRLASDTNYVRYWLGFRIYVRPMLALMNYMDARQCIMWGFVLLMGAVTVLLYRQTRSVLLALAFPAALCQLNPIVIMSCFQYSACFYLAMIAMLLTPLIRGKRFTPPMFFLAIGMLTQIFDFFTAPLLTFGLPMCMLLLNRDGERLDAAARWRLMLLCLLGWFGGYAGAWMMKLLATTLLTPINAIEDGFTRLGYWMLPGQGTTDLLLPFKAVYWNALNLLDVVSLAAEGLILLLYILCVLRKRPARNVFPLSAVYLAIALLPLLWFMVAARPSYEQFYFQYRSLGVSLFAGLVFLILTAGWDRLLPDEKTWAHSKEILVPRAK
jgi:hypothetical protein